MRFQCDTIVANRKNPALDSPKSYSTISLFKSVDAAEILLYVHSPRNRSGTKYLLKSNLGRVHSKFISEGKLTLSLIRPPVDIILSNVGNDVCQRFLDAVKVGYKGEDVKELKLSFYSSSCSKQCKFDRPKMKMRISHPSQYPHSSKFPRTLTKLLINGCSLSKMDSRILKLKQLKLLDLSQNLLSSLPCLDTLASLKEINLADNHFVTIPDTLLSRKMLKSLRSLDLSRNRLSSIDRKMCEMTSIVTLDLSHNQISELPSRICKLETLRYLMVSNNHISSLPSSLLALRLTTLHLDGNRFAAPFEINEQRCVEIIANAPSLRETCARFIIDSGHPFNVDILPVHLQHYLESGETCQCTNSCFETRSPYTYFMDTHDLMRETGALTLDMTDASIRIQGYHCSLPCYNWYIFESKIDSDSD